MIKVILVEEAEALLTTRSGRGWRSDRGDRAIAIGVEVDPKLAASRTGKDAIGAPIDVGVHLRRFGEERRVAIGTEEKDIVESSRGNAFEKDTVAMEERLHLIGIGKHKDRDGSSMSLAIDKSAKSHYFSIKHIG